MELQLPAELWSKLPWLPISETYPKEKRVNEEHPIDRDQDLHTKNYRFGSTAIESTREVFMRSRRLVYSGRKVEDDDAILSIDTADCRMTELSLSKKVVGEIVGAFGALSQAFSQHRDVQLQDDYILEDAKNLEKYIENIEEDSISFDSIELSLVNESIGSDMTSKSIEFATIPSAIDDTAHTSGDDSLQVADFSETTNSSHIKSEHPSQTGNSAMEPAGDSPSQRMMGSNFIRRISGQGRLRCSATVDDAARHRTLTGAPGLSTAKSSAVASESFTQSQHTALDDALTGSHECQDVFFTKSECTERRLNPGVGFLRRWRTNSRKWQKAPVPLDSGLAKINEATTDDYDIALADSTEQTTNTNSTSKTGEEMNDVPRQTDVSSLSSSSTETSDCSKNRLTKSENIVRHIYDKAQLSTSVLKYVKRQRRNEASNGACAPSAVELIEDQLSFASTTHTAWIESTGQTESSERNSDLKLQEVNQNAGRNWIHRLRSKERSRSGKSLQKCRETNESIAKPGQVLDSKFAEWIKHVVLSDDDSSLHEDWIEDTTLVDFSLNHNDRIRGMTFLDSARRDILKDGGAEILSNASSGAQSEPMGPTLTTIGGTRKLTKSGMVRTESAPASSPFHHYLFIPSVRSTSQESPRRVQTFSSYR